MATPDRTTPPALRDFSPLAMPESRVTTLDNDVDLHIIDGAGYDIASLTLMWQFGNADAAAMGVCHETPNLAAQMLREGSVKYSGAEIADIVDFEGAMLSARATEHYTLIELTALSKSLPTLLPVVADMAMHPTIPADAFAGVLAKTAMQRDINMAKPSAVADNAFVTLMAGPNHPYARQATGDELRAITRDDIMAVHRRGFSSAKMHIIYSGPTDPAKIALITDLAYTLRSAAASATSVIVSYSPQAPQIITAPHDDPNQIAVSMGLPTVNRDHPDYVDLRMTVMALGGHFGSRLNSNIRERLGLTYGISAALLGQVEGAYMNVQAQCRRGTSKQVCREIANEIERLASEPLNADEFAGLRSIVASALAMNVDSPLAVMRHHVSTLLTGMPASYYSDQWLRWQALTPATICRMAEQYLNPAELRTVVTGE